MRLTGKVKPVMEVRAFSTEVRASPVEDGSGALRFEGYAALFNSWSQDLGGFREQIAPGAFTKALTADDVRALLNHDKNYVLGRNRSGTLVLTEDERGLRFEVTAPNTQWARDLAESVKRGDIDQCSFGFQAVRDDWRTADGIDERTLMEVRLFDVSIVTYPAYLDTNANVRSCAEVFAEHREAAPAGAPARVGLMRMQLDLKKKEMGIHE
jgi:HK97 family phage prohead protease